MVDGEEERVEGFGQVANDAIWRYGWRAVVVDDDRRTSVARCHQRVDGMQHRLGRATLAKAARAASAAREMG